MATKQLLLIKKKPSVSALERINRASYLRELKPIKKLNDEKENIC